MDRRQVMINPATDYFILTFCLSWIFWIPMIMMGGDHFLLRVAGTYGPVTAALLLTANKEGFAGLKRLFSPLRLWKAGLFWYLFCFLSTAVLTMTAIGISFLLIRNKPLFHDPGELSLIIPAFMYVLFFSVLGEETGWRGYALPKLQRKYGVLNASITIGMIGALWHLPLFFIEGNFHQEIPIWLFILQGISLSVVMGWIYNNTEGSLLLIHFFHAASNTTLGFLPVLPKDAGGDPLPLYILCGLLTLLALSITLWGKLEEVPVRREGDDS